MLAGVFHVNRTAFGGLEGARYEDTCVDHRRGRTPLLQRPRSTGATAHRHKKPRQRSEPGLSLPLVSEGPWKNPRRSYSGARHFESQRRLAQLRRLKCPRVEFCPPASL